MSNEQNTQLLERARVQCEVWTGTLHEALIRADIERKDYEQLAADVHHAEIQSYKDNFEPTEDVY